MAWELYIVFNGTHPFHKKLVTAHSYKLLTRYEDGPIRIPLDLASPRDDTNIARNRRSRQVIVKILADSDSQFCLNHAWKRTS